MLKSEWWVKREKKKKRKTIGRRGTSKKEESENKSVEYVTPGPKRSGSMGISKFSKKFGGRRGGYKKTENEKIFRSKTNRIREEGEEREK